MNTAFNPTFLLDLTTRLQRSWWTVVAGLCFGLAGGVGALHYLPRTYEATTTIFVAPQQVPQDFIRSTVTDDMSMRLSSLREAVLSRPYLIKLITDTFGRPEDEQQLEHLMNMVRSRVTVDVTLMDRYGSARTGGVFNLTYRDSDPERAANVVNTLVKYYIEQNVSFRTALAQGTTQTILGLVDEVKKQMSDQETKIAEYKSKHLFETAEHYQANLQQLQGRRHDLETNEVALAAAGDRLAVLKAQQTQAERDAGATALAGAGLANPRAMRVATLQRELEVLESKYSDDHPDVKAKKREIEDALALMQPSTEAGSEGEPAGAADALSSPIGVQIHSAQQDIARLQADRTRIQSEIAMYERRVEATPQVEAQVAELTKGYDGLQELYKLRQRNLDESRGAERIEETQKGERFEVIDRATPPALPIRPVPMIVHLVGLGAGLGLFLGPLVLLAFFDPRIQSEASIQQACSVPVLVSIPRLATPATSASVRRRWLYNVCASILSVGVLAASMALFR